MSYGFVIQGEKENVPDMMESQVREMLKELKEFCIKIYGYDPLLSKGEIEAFGVKSSANLAVKNIKWIVLS